MLELIPERWRTPRVARAMASPSAILLSGAAVAGVIASGLPIVLVPVAAVGGWLARVAVALPREPKEQRILPSTLHDPWRSYVSEALAAKNRFERTRFSIRKGPLQDRLTELGARIDVGVREVWRIAQQGDQLHSAQGRLNTDAVMQELYDVRAQRKRYRDNEQLQATLERTEASLQSQLGSYSRIAQLADEAENRLRLLTAQLDEAVARSIELSVHQGDVHALNSLGADVDGLIMEMENLRQALEETAGAPVGGELRQSP